MRLLFTKHSLAWPRASGHDVHAFHMMKACGELGHEVSLATFVEPSAEALTGLPLTAWYSLESPPERMANQFPVIRKTRLQERFRSFYGIPDARLAALNGLAGEVRPDAVVLVGLDALPYLPALPLKTIRVWYAADEWVWHHLSQLRLGHRDLGSNLRDAAIKGIYERAYRRLVDRAWVVSETERRAMRWLAGIARVDVLPNGVDGEYFRPSSRDAVEPRSAVFWGRLDFGPNIQALEWFCGKVWPIVRARVPDARFTIIGFNPSKAVRHLASGNGISLMPDLEDLRPTARRHSLAVLPFVSGGGIKNKLLEAAALGLPIVCTPTATVGLRGLDDSPLLVTSTPEQMTRTIEDLWTDAGRREQLSARVRAWVLEYHTWTAAARDAVAGLERCPSRVAVPRGGEVAASQGQGLTKASDRTQPVRVGFVLHSMQVAGAEVLVAETIRRLRGRIEPVVFCLDEVGALGDRVRGEGVEVLVLGRRPGLDLTIIPRMARAIRSRQLQVLHAHQYTPFFYGALAARLSGVGPRVVFTEHGRHYPDVVSAKRRLANRLVFDRLADRVNAVCAFSARSLVECDGFRSKRIEVIENGVDLTKYGRPADARALRVRLGLDPERRYIANVARFHPVKDHPTLLRAFLEVSRARADVDLLLVGDGSLRGELEALANDLGVAARVRFLGVRNDVADVLRAVDLFALTSVSEAASITLLEAMAAGLPVVVTAVGGNPELVRDGIDGLLAPRGDHHAIAAAMLRLLGDADLARAMGRAGAERVRTQFRIDRTIERYYELYVGATGAENLQPVSRFFRDRDRGPDSSALHSRIGP